MRYLGLWPVRGRKLSENWVMIDYVDVFRQFGHDILAGLPTSK